jgi:hypothetical protein
VGVPDWVLWLIFVLVLVNLPLSLWMLWLLYGIGAPARTRTELERAYHVGAISREVYDRWYDRLS